MNEIDFFIADLRIRLNMPNPIVITKRFEPFLECAEDITEMVDLNVRVTEISNLPALPDKEIFRNEIFRVYEAGAEYIRYYHDHKEADRPYAVMTYDWDEGAVHIRYLMKDRMFFSESANSFSHIAFEELLLSRDRLILHASLIDSDFGGILFSGVSGIGKSTQADLWRLYEGSTVINGDRPILCRAAEGWRAYGSPYAGSSRCHINRNVPIRAIVMLEQGDTCDIHRLNTAEAFRRLYAGTVINSWNDRYVNKACDLLTDIAIEVPVYCMSCTPDRNAVDTLKSVLKQEVGEWT